MFDPNEALPSNYGYAGEDPSQLSSLATGSGTLPGSYGSAPSVPQQSPKAETTPVGFGAAEDGAKESSAGAFARGLSTAIQQSRVYQSSGAATPASETTAAAQAAQAAQPAASSNWKLYASLGAATLLIGGAVWYFTRNREK